MFATQLEVQLAGFATDLIAQIRAGELDMPAALAAYSQAIDLQAAAYGIVAAVVEGFETAMSTKP